MSDDTQPPNEQGGLPQHWHDFLRTYGGAVYAAQMLENNLAIVLWFFEARKRGVLRKPTPQDIDAMIEEIDGNTLGELLDRLAEHHLNYGDMQLFREANANRRILVHRFSTTFPGETGDDSDFGEATTRVVELAQPIRAARDKAWEIAHVEIERMRSDTLGPFRSLFS